MSKLEETLLVILEKALALAEQTGEFVIDQAPELLQQFYSWHIAQNILTICVFILSLTLFAISYKKADFETDDADLFVILMAVFGASTLVSVGFALDAIYKLVFISVAPKLYLIEYFIK